MGGTYQSHLRRPSIHPPLVPLAVTDRTLETNRMRRIVRLAYVSAFALSTTLLLHACAGTKGPTPPSDCNYEGFPLAKDATGCYYVDSEGAKHYINADACDCL